MKQPILSILICTMPQRKAMMNTLLNELYRQIRERNLENDIEILWLTDEQPVKMSIGQKRQQLIEQTMGEYVCFIDDDDWVAPDYIRIIHAALMQRPDVVGITGIITINGRQKTAKKFIHSSQYKSYFEKNGTYYRPPNHLNPMRIDIAKKVEFKNKSHGEDTDWAMELCKLKPYNKELFIQKPIYFYRYQLKPIYK